MIFFLCFCQAQYTFQSCFVCLPSFLQANAFPNSLCLSLQGEYCFLFNKNSLLQKLHRLLFFATKGRGKGVGERDARKCFMLIFIHSTPDKINIHRYCIDWQPNSATVLSMYIKQTITPSTGIINTYIFLKHRPLCTAITTSCLHCTCNPGSFILAFEGSASFQAPKAQSYCTENERDVCHSWH